MCIEIILDQVCTYIKLKKDREELILCKVDLFVLLVAVTQLHN